VQKKESNRRSGNECSVSSSTAGQNNDSPIDQRLRHILRAYTINVRLHKVAHHLEGALVSSDISKNFNRSFRLRRSADLFAINESSHGRQPIALTWKKVGCFSSREDPCR
jgi:hypothetical protein